MEETLNERQKKINNLLQQEIASLLQRAIRQADTSNFMVSISKVRVAVDLSIARVYVSFFPTKNSKEQLKSLQENTAQLRHDLSQILRHDLRRVPELVFYLDDSLDYIEGIEKALSEGENPIKKPNSLSKSQKK